MIEQRTAHTADLSDDTRTAVRALMDAAFGGVSDDTFDNVLGGLHALVFEDGEPGIQAALLVIIPARRPGRPRL